MKWVICFIIIIILLIGYVMTAILKESLYLKIINNIIKSKKDINNETKDSLMQCLIQLDLLPVNYDVTGSAELLHSIYNILKESDTKDLRENLKQCILDYQKESNK